MRVAKLNDEGILKFRSWIIDLKNDPKLPPPMELLAGADYTTPFVRDIQVQRKRFSNRSEFCSYLHNLMGGISLSKLDRGFWSWISLFFIDDLIPLESNGTRIPRALARYIPEQDNYRRYYRHLLAGPYHIYHAHKDNPNRALALLCQPLNKPGDVYEQLASRQEIASNPNIMSLATALYVNPKTRTIKSGAGGKASGSARRLIAVLEQFDLTWDLYSASTEELLNALPKEFSKYR